MQHNTYVIEAGQAGKQRLSLIGRVLQPTTAQLFARLGLRAGMQALDVGCGGGVVTLELARLVGTGGFVVGLDVDTAIVALAQQDAASAGMHNIEFRRADALQLDEPSTYDLVYARFLLTHLAEPQQALAGMVRAARPGGLLVAEDIDLTGSFCYPPHPAFQRQLDLYTQVIRHTGGDPAIGLRLTDLFLQAGLHDVDLHVVQPVYREDEGKHLFQITLERVAGALTAAEIANAAEVAATVAELAAFAERRDTIIGLPRIFQVWGSRAVP
jgi:SAM-dependent methyltransferase